MTTSYFDGFSRGPLRVGLASVAAIDLVSTGVSLATTAAGPRSHPLAPAWLLSFGGAPVLVIALVALGLVGLAIFARGRHVVAGGALGLAMLALSNESLAAVWLGPSRSHFFAGALLIGWLAGFGHARASGRAHDDAEARAESAAIGVLVAIYLGAVTSKLLHAGPSWADATTLRGVLASHARVSGTGLGHALAELVIDHPSIGRGLALATLVVQAGSVALLVNRRARAGWSVLLFGFHVSVSLMTGIGYLGAKLLVPLFCLPWPLWTHARWGFPPRVAGVAVEPDRARETRSNRVALVVLVVLFLLALVLPIRKYTGEHHHHAGAEADRDALKTGAVCATARSKPGKVG